MPAEQKELRQMTPTHLLEFIDAAALARNMDRTRLINKILLQWAEVEAHRSTVLHRATKGNPLMSASAGPTTDWGDLV